VNCLIVRDRLAERALGALPSRELGPIDRHLVWCAACRKEAGQLDSAAAMLAFSVAPAADGPAPDLEDRVVEAVQREAAARRTGVRSSPRRGRFVVAGILAAALALSGLGWGAVMAGRAAKSDQAAKAAQQGQESAIERFADLVNSADFSDRQGDVFLGTLEATHEGTGGGSALTLVSPSIPDMAIVLLDGVPVAERSSVPFSVRLVGPRGASLPVGEITSLDDGGSGIVVQKFEAANLTPYDRVVVRDVDGHIVMRGAIAARAPIASPSP
jgi:anti-sigma factor RsiW